MGQVTILALVALLGWVPGVKAEAVQASGSRHFSLLAETMQPIDSSIEYNNFSAFLTTTQNSSVSSATSYIGQLDLPDGAQITAVRCEGLDSDTTGEFFFRLYRYTLYNDPVWSDVTDFAYSGYAWSGGKITVVADINSVNAVVDNDNYAYAIILVLPLGDSGPLGFLRCVIDTSYSNNLPLVQNGNQE